MDVRCENCQTEYELDESSVSEDGTDVQCSSCGHTFKVKRPAGRAAITASEEDGLPAARWQMETRDGQRHDFRGLPALQKWIIERRVTRDDRISRDGEAWLRLGDLTELSAFFEVVDEADRARVATTATPTASIPASAPAERQRSSLGNLAVWVESGARGSYPRAATSDLETDLVAAAPKSGGGYKVVVGLVVACAVAYAGIAWQESRGRRAADSAGMEAKAERDQRAAASASAPGAGPAEHVRPLVQPLPAGDQGAVAVQTASSQATDGGQDADRALSKGKTVAPAGTSTKARYGRLVHEGDRLLENGSIGKARQLYEHALRLRPGGMEALSGLGYTALARGQTSAATTYFRRAMVSRPFGPALFGLAEIYRSTGNAELALRFYKRYLQVDPDGAEAGTARRRVRTLGNEP